MRSKNSLFLLLFCSISNNRRTSFRTVPEIPVQNHENNRIYKQPDFKNPVFMRVSEPRIRYSVHGTHHTLLFMKPKPSYYMRDP